MSFVQEIQELIKTCPTNWNITVTINSDDFDVALYYFGVEREYETKTIGHLTVEGAIRWRVRYAIEQAAKADEAIRRQQSEDCRKSWLIRE